MDIEGKEGLKCSPDDVVVTFKGEVLHGYDPNSLVEGHSTKRLWYRVLSVGARETLVEVSTDLLRAELTLASGSKGLKRILSTVPTKISPFTLGEKAQAEEHNV